MTVTFNPCAPGDYAHETVQAPAPAASTTASSSAAAQAAATSSAPAEATRATSGASFAGKLRRSEEVRRFVQEYAKDFSEKKVYEQLHAELKEKFPTLGPADGTPIGLLLSNLKQSDLVGNPHALVHSKEDCDVGDVLVSYEPAEAELRPNRRITVQKQQADHNGIPDSMNQGDARNVHTALWVHTEGNPMRPSQWADGEPEVVEGRAARDWPKPINRIQPSSVSPAEVSHAKVYRLTDPVVASFLAQNAMFLAQGNVSYSMKDLSLSFSNHVVGGKPNEKAGTIGWDAESLELAPVYAKEAFKGDPSWALNPENIHDSFVEGGSCSTIMGKNLQAVMLHVLRARAVEKFGTENAPEFHELVPHLQGLYQTNPIFLSPRTWENQLLLCKNEDGSPQAQFVGKFSTKHATYPEEVPPHDAKLGPAIPDTDPRSHKAESDRRAAVKAAQHQAQQQGLAS